jgi:outer membrane receptor for ferrienterochelin and colicins
MRHILTYLLLTYFIGLSLTEAATISGRIIDESNSKAIVGAKLDIPELSILTRSGNEGEFKIQLDESGSCQLKISHIAYETVFIQLEFNEKDIETTIRLSPRTYYSDDVVVTATRTPYLLKDVPVTTEIIRIDEALKTGASTIDEALESMTGVNISQNFSGTGASLRGMDPSRVLILLDGERIVGRVRGSIDLSQLGLDNVEKIEVVKGIGSTLYGSDAIGGVINIITKKASNHPHINSSTEYSTFNSLVQTLDGEFQNGQTSFLLGGRFYRTDGFDLIKETPHTNGMENIWNYNINSKVTRKLSRSFEVIMLGGFFHENKKWLESEYIPPRTYSFDDKESNYRYLGSAKLLYNPTSSTYIDFNLYATLYDHLWEKYSGDIRTDYARTEDAFGEFSVLATHSYSPGHVITMGTDLLYQSLSGGSIEGEKQSISSGDIFAEYEWKPSISLTIMPGIRLESHSTYGEHVNASVNIMLNPHSRFRLRASYGGGFRAPSIKELYYRFDHSAAGYLIEGGSDNLVPETSLNSSLSLEYSYGKKGLHRLTYFYNHLSNLIDFDKISENAVYWRGIFQYQNVFRAYTRGIEWQSSLRFTSSQSVTFSYTWLTAKNLETGHWLLGRPEHSLSIKYSISLDSYGLTMTAWGNWLSKKLWTPAGSTNNFESDIIAPSRHEINLSLAKKLSNSLELFIRAKNITDDVDAVYGYWPGRSFHIGLRFTKEAK